MRITGGILLGRQVKVPNATIRPAMDRMRESVFSILGDLSGKSFLDFFSGSGIIALEAASRGAVDIEAVESDSRKRATLLENVKISPLSIKCRFMPVELYVKRAKHQFDIIFCDPPFNYRYKLELVNSIASSKLMEKGSLLVLHYPKEEPFGEIPLNLVLKDTREFGRSLVKFFDFYA